MITINLLPQIRRKSGASSLDHVRRSPLALWGVIGVLAITGCLVLLKAFRQQQLTRLTGRLQQLEAKKQDINNLKTALQQFRDQQAIYQGLAKGRSRWARRLNALSDLMPDGVWLTDLTLDPANGLVIQGAAVEQGEEVMAQIGRLVQALKDDPDFSQAVRDVQIESIKSTKEGDLDVTQFALICAMVQEPAGPPPATREAGG